MATFIVTKSNYTEGVFTNIEDVVDHIGLPMDRGSFTAFGDLEFDNGYTVYGPTNLLLGSAMQVDYS